MKNRPWVRLALVLAILAGAGACREFPTRPANRSPIITDVAAFPIVLGPGDSAIVTVFATDPDGDSLVYDWSTDSRLIFKGRPPDQHDVPNSPNRSQVVYRSVWSLDDSTAWVRCSARDRRGGGSPSRLVEFTLLP